MRRLILLFWSISPEPAYSDYLRRNYDEVIVIPLRHFARENMRPMFPDAQEMVMGEIVEPSERRRIWNQTVDYANQCWQGIAQNTHRPWMSGIYQDVLFQHIYAYQYWQYVLDQLQERYPEAEIKCHGPLSFCAIGDGCTSFDVRCLEWLLAARAAPPPPSRRAGVRALLNSLAGCLGGLVNRHGRWFLRASPGPPEAHRKTPVVVFGLQATDCKVQGPLVSLLGRKSPEKYCWLVPDTEWDNLTIDEKNAMGLEDHSLDLADRISFDPSGLYLSFQWKSAWFSRLSALHVKRQLAGFLSRDRPKEINASEWNTLAGLVVAHQPDIYLRYASIAALLDKYEPDFVVANSNWHVTTMVRGWARSRKRRFIQLPHGSSFTHTLKYAWDADELFVLGAYERDALEKGGGGAGANVTSVGGLHFEKQASAESAVSVSPKDRIWEAVWLLSVSPLYGMPDTYHELDDDVRMWARVLHNAGGRLVLRCHRREDINHVYEHITARCVEDGLPVRMSDPMSSLNGDLAASEFALVRTWGGAGLLALYAKTPVIGFMPRAGLPGSDDILSLLPLVARDEASSTDIVRDLRRDISFQNTILEQQETVLEHLCENPRSGHSYERAADLIVELVNG